MWSVASLYLAELEIRFVAITVYSYGAAILARSIVEGIYIFYKRPRPSSADHIEPLIINTNPSFPSGHAAFFGALAFALVSVQAPFALEFSIATIIMCIARVAAGVHFLSDIAVGWLLGMGTTVLVFSMIGIY
jgi:undecaprenyl-diphosphatase